MCAFVCVYARACVCRNNIDPNLLISSCAQLPFSIWITCPVSVAPQSRPVSWWPIHTCNSSSCHVFSSPPHNAVSCKTTIHINTRIHIHTHARTHTQTRTYIQTYTQTYTCTHIRTHTHTQRNITHSTKQQTYNITYLVTTSYNYMIILIICTYTDTACTHM